MRVAKEPRVYLLSQPAINWSELEQLLKDEAALGTIKPRRAGENDERLWEYDVAASNAESLVEFAGRMCYLSFGQAQGRTDTGEYLRNILDMGHGSVLEHAVFTFAICDVSRSLSHELVRHRPFAISQQSSRYVQPGHEAVMPPALLKSPADVQQYWEKSTDDAFTAGENLASTWHDNALDSEPLPVGDEDWASIQWSKTKRRLKKQAHEVARSLMPTDAVTRLVVSGNVREWRWFCQLRGTEDTDPEIRRLAVVIATRLKEEVPLLFGDFRISDTMKASHWKV